MNVAKQENLIFRRMPEYKPNIMALILKNMNTYKLHSLQIVVVMSP